MGVLLLLQELAHEVAAGIPILVLLPDSVQIGAFNDRCSVLHELLEHYRLGFAGFEGLPLQLLFLVGLAEEFGLLAHCVHLRAYSAELFVLPDRFRLHVFDHFLQLCDVRQLVAVAFLSLCSAFGWGCSCRLVLFLILAAVSPLLLLGLNLCG